MTQRYVLSGSTLHQLDRLCMICMDMQGGCIYAMTCDGDKELLYYFANSEILRRCYLALIDWLGDKDPDCLVFNFAATKDKIKMMEREQ